MPLPAALAAGAELILSGLLLLAGVLALFALVDVPLQRHMLTRRLRMSAVEMKKELKDSEGNAEIKGRLKARMRELGSRRMLAAVRLADLVVMNPEPLCGGAEVRRKQHGRAARGGQGCGPAGVAHPRPGA